MNKNKVYIAAFLITLGFFAVIGRLFYFQVLKQQEFLEYIKKQYYAEEKIILPRGTIYDQNGRILGISVPTIDVFAIKRYVKNKEKVAKELSKILKIPYQQLLRKLNGKKNYVVLARNIDSSYKDRILALRRSLQEWNLGVVESSKRYYPLGSIAGSSIGFVNKYTGQGTAGLELKYDSLLGGGFASIVLMKDALGNPITIEKEKNDTNIKDIKLTIDSNIQYIAEEALKKLVKERRPKEAAILIMDSNTGEIIANATYPNYNPNKYWKYKNHKNISFQNAYEVGSLAKPFVLAEAIDENKIDFLKKYYCGEGKVIVDGVRIRDHKSYKNLTPEDIIVHSSNGGIINIALRLDPDKLYERFRKLGFGKSTKTFPGEASGLIRPFKRKIDVAYASIGQNWTATLVQVAVAYSAIANGGYLVKPHFVKEIIDSSSGESEKINPEKMEKVLSDESVKKLQDILVQVVERGTAKRGKSEYFTIAGKTGTAQKYDPAIKALSNEKFYTWFAGYFPAENPKFTVVIFANEPKRIKKWEFIGGGSVSAPVLKFLVDRIMFYYKQKPDKEVEYGNKNPQGN